MYFNFNVTVLVLVESIKNQNLLIVFVTAHYCPQSASPQLPQVIIFVNFSLDSWRYERATFTRMLSAN